MLNYIFCNIKAILEILYLIGGIFISVTVFIAFWQLKLTKETLVINSKRDAFRITAEQCENYLKNIVPLHLELNSQIEKNNVKCFDYWKVEIINNAISISHDPPIVNNDSQPVIDIIITTLDAMEAFSNYFIFGIADEEKAYRSVGSSYIAIIEKLMPVIMKFTEMGHYRNTVDLFAMWKGKNDKQRLYSDLHELSDKLSQIPNNYIQPIGI